MAKQNLIMFLVLHSKKTPWLLLIVHISYPRESIFSTAKALIWSLEGASHLICKCYTVHFAPLLSYIEESKVYFRLKNPRYLPLVLKILKKKKIYDWNI